MPRTSLVTVEEAVATIEKFIDYFQDGKYPQYSSDIWKQMSSSLEGKWSPNNLYNNVIQNRRKIMQIACEKQNIPFIPFISKNKKYIDNSLLSDRDSSDDDNIDNNDNDNDFEFEGEADKLDEFNVILTSKEWNCIQSSNVVYKDNRNYSILKSDCWTDILAVAIFRSTKLPCAYSFKYARINSSTESKHYLTIRGYCKSKRCKNILFAYLYRKPEADVDVHLTIKTKETWWTNHEPVKRQLRGSKRQRVGEQAFYEGTANFCKREILQNTDFDGRVPPHVPHSHAVSAAKKDYSNNLLGIKSSDGKDLIKTIETMSYSGPYTGCIHEVRRKKFYVSFSSPMQLYTYKKYCRTTRNSSSISIDGTGSLVKPIIHEDGSSSGHIFLYSVTINFDGSTLSVYDMFTESQDTDIICWWLRQWLRLGAPKPKEVVCDSSRALMNGISQAFNFQTVKTYVETCFLYAIGHNEYHHRPPIHTYLRLDVAHFINMIRNWKCFTYLRHTQVRRFYLYCIALLVDCQTINQFREIFELMCIVGLNENEDAIIEKTNSTVLSAKNKLENYISLRNFDSDFKIVENNSNDITIKEDKQNVAADDEFNEDNGNSQTSDTSRIKNYIDNVYKEATVLSSKGSKPNICFFEDFILEFKARAYEFPLWSAVSLPYKADHASTTHVEGHFNIIKHNIMKNYHLPLRIDKVLKLILNDYFGNATNVQSKLTDYYQSNAQFPSPLPKQTIITKAVITKDESRLEEKNSRFCQYDPKVNDIDDYNDEVSSNFNEHKEKEILNVYDCDKKNQPFSKNNPSKSGNSVNDNSFSSKNNYCLPRNISSNTILSSKATNKKGFYFEPKTKMQEHNVQDLPLLLNGNRIVNPANIRGTLYFASNTCGFDSIVQILSACAMDDSTYMTYIKTSDNRVLQFIKFFIDNGSSAKVYKERILVLKDVFTNNNYISEKTKLKSYIIDLYDNLTSIYTTAFNLLPSGWFTHNCLICGAYSSPVAYLQLTNDNVVLKNGFSALQEALNYEWQKTSCSKGCNSYCQRRLDNFNTQIFIELDIRRSVELSDSLRGKLSDFPIKLNLNNNSYRLGGVIVRTPGHYISYCRRINDRWDFCNDLSCKVISVRRDTQVEPHGVLYIKEFLNNNKHIENVVLKGEEKLENCLEDGRKQENNLGTANSLSKTPLDDSDTISRDNWRNKETVTNFYFNTTQSFNESSLKNDLTTESLECGMFYNYNEVLLLKPGNILPGIVINGEIFHLTDTCAFDSIIHILSCSAIVNTKYMDFLKKSKNETIQFILDFIEMESLTYIYERRALLLKSLYASTIFEDRENSICTYTVNVDQGVSDIWKTCLNDDASVFNAYVCKSCDNSSFVTPLLKIDSKKIIKDGFKALNEAIIFHNTLKKVKCHQKNCQELCTVTANLNFHIFVEMDVVGKNLKSIRCNLEDVPTTIHLDIHQYKLAGIIAENEHHTIAYCLKADGTWELHDGHMETIQTIIGSTVIQPMSAIYLLIN